MAGDRAKMPLAQSNVRTRANGADYFVIPIEAAKTVPVYHTKCLYFSDIFRFFFSSFFYFVFGVHINKRLSHTSVNNVASNFSF